MAGDLLCFEKACDFCGARLEVTAAEIGGTPRPHAYRCAQCGKNDEVTTTGIPHVRVLAPRADGRTIQYSETMF